MKELVGLEAKSIIELQALANSTAKVLKEKQAAVRETAVKQIEEIARNAGIKVFIRGTPKKDGDAALKTYQHPDKAELTWSGKGAKPKWLKDYLKAGRDMAEFEVKADQVTV